MGGFLWAHASLSNPVQVFGLHSLPDDEDVVVHRIELALLVVVHLVHAIVDLELHRVSW